MPLLFSTKSSLSNGEAGIKENKMKKLLLAIAVLSLCFTAKAEAVLLDLSDETDGTLYSIAGNDGLFGRFVDSGQGTGNFDSFLRVQGKNNDTDDDDTTEFGYNTDGD